MSKFALNLHFDGDETKTDSENLLSLLTDKKVVLTLDMVGDDGKAVKGSNMTRDDLQAFRDEIDKKIAVLDGSGVTLV